MAESKSSLFTLIIIIIIVVVAVVVSRGTSWERDDDKIRAIKDALNIGKVSLSNEMINMCSGYRGREDQFAGNEFVGWDTNTDQLSEFSLFGVKLLDYCATYEPMYSENYQTIVTTMVEHLVEKLEGHRPDDDELERVPWGTDRFVFFAHVTRFLAMYEYVGSSRSLKQRCHNQLVRIVPTIGRSLQPVNTKTEEGMNLLYQAVPRLCSNWMFDKEEYERDTANPNFLALEKFMKFDRVIEEMPPRDGIYCDDSWVINGNVPSYSNLLRFYNYHERVYNALGFKTPIREIAEVVLEKLMHPTIKYQPLGLVNNTGEVYIDKDYWNITPKNHGVHLMPFIGLGVFKTDQFLFHVRVQRRFIAAFEIDTENDPKLGIGALQMRKLYLKDKAYPKTLNWSTLKNQPGMMTFDDETMTTCCKDLKVEENYKVRSIFTRRGDIASYVGHLEDTKLLFWFNYYYFGIYSIFVTEMGVVTGKGLQALYIIDSDSKDALKFAFKDSNERLTCKATAFTQFMREDTQSKSDPTSIGVGEMFVDCEPNKYTTIRWKMMLNDSPDDYKLEFSGSDLSFEYGNEKYTCIRAKNNRYYVKRGDEIVLGGSASSDPNDSFTLDKLLDEQNYQFTRNPKTLMYTPKVVG